MKTIVFAVLSLNMLLMAGSIALKAKLKQNTKIIPINRSDPSSSGVVDMSQMESNSNSDKANQYTDALVSE